MTAIQQFYRGSRPMSAANHVVWVLARSGVSHFRRVSMTYAQMCEMERYLMEQKHLGAIVDYKIDSAAECSAAELQGWLESLISNPQQAELIDIQQNTLFAGGAQ